MPRAAHAEPKGRICERWSAPRAKCGAKQAQEWPGYSDPATTLRHYVRPTTAARGRRRSRESTRSRGPRSRLPRRRAWRTRRHRTTCRVGRPTPL